MMKKIAAITLMLVLTLVTASPACMTNNSHDKDLFAVFNHFFFDSKDKGKFSSDIELLNSAYFLNNGEDILWGDAGDTFRIDVTYRDARLQQSLGYLDHDGYHDLLGYKEIQQHRYTQQGDTFQAQEAFRWADTIGLMGSDLQRWSSDPAENPLGQKDHFLSFAVTDNALLSVFNQLYGTSYDAGVDQVWMIAFEDLNLGDADYTDLVAVISKPVELNPVPLPGTVVLLSSALAGLTIRRRRG
jgi:hypothetical protein